MNAPDDTQPSAPQPDDTQPTEACNTEDRRLGALLGLAAGDALGTTLEFTRPTGLPRLPTLIDGPHREITGGGPLDAAPGEVTDDTQMAAALASALSGQARYRPFAAASRYASWLEAGPKDVGNQTASAIRHFMRGARNGGARPSTDEAGTRLALRAGYDAWADAAFRGAGNGGLMRTAPVAVHFWRESQAEARNHGAVADSMVTHYDPRSLLACAAYDAGVAAAIRGARGDALVSHATGALDAAVEMARVLHGEAVGEDPEGFGHRLRRAADEIRRDLDAARRDDPRVYGEEDASLHLLEKMGFVRVAFRLAFWYALHVDDLRAALVDVVNRGGDSDTNGAIVGALIGARDGAGAVPDDWTTLVLGARMAPRFKAFHPERMIEALVEPC